MTSLIKLLRGSWTTVRPKTSQCSQSPSVLLLHDLSKVNPLYKVMAQSLSEIQDYDLYGFVVNERIWVTGKVADLYRGTLKDPNHPDVTGSSIVMKRIRISSDGKLETERVKVIMKGIQIWTSLEHRYVLPCLGFTIIDDFPCFVSEFMANRGVMEYTRKNPHIDRYALIWGIACGMEYLHSQNIVHPDLKSGNVLVSDEGWPKICGFEIIGAIAGGGTITGEASLKGTLRWTPVELIGNSEHDIKGNKRHRVHTRESNVWSFGMIVYEIVTGNIPFYKHNSANEVFHAISYGELPEFPLDEYQVREFNLIRDVCNMCWARNPKDRPTMNSVMVRLSENLQLADDEMKDRFWCIDDVLADSPLDLEIFSPENFDVTDRLTVGVLRQQGGCADVFEGTLKGHGNISNVTADRPVAVKRIRVTIPLYSDNKTEIRDKQLHSFERELKIWISLKHDNVLPCLGFAKHEGIPALISEWMVKGNLRQHLENVPTNKLEMARGIICGLEYVHSEGVVHSDLKGANILISAAGTPMLSDFGTSRVVRAETTLTGTSTFKFSLRWTAIELLMPGDTTGLNFGGKQYNFHTASSDVWAFGMVLYEILTLRDPFYGVEEERVVGAITSGKLPQKSESDESMWNDGLENLWKVSSRCWARNPAHRPTAAKIVRLLRARS